MHGRFRSRRRIDSQDAYWLPSRVERRVVCPARNEYGASRNDLFCHTDTVLVFHHHFRLAGNNEYDLLVIRMVMTSMALAWIKEQRDGAHTAAVHLRIAHDL